MNFLKNLFNNKTPDLQQFINEGALLVDVREPAEFADGSVPGAVNIPLGRIGLELKKFENKKHIIVFCRSGMRSGQAKLTLNQNGFNNVVNAGAMENISRFVTR